MVSFITRKSRANCGFIIGCLSSITRMSCEYFTDKPNHKKEPFGQRPKGDRSKNTFFVRKTWKNVHFSSTNLMRKIS